MITVIWYSDGLCEAVVGSPRSLSKLLSLLEAGRTEFKVYCGGNYVTPKDFGWGMFDYWIAKDKNFKS